MNPREYEGNLKLIMERYARQCKRQGFNVNHGKVMRYHHFMYFWHILCISFLSSIKNAIGEKDFMN